MNIAIIGSGKVGKTLGAAFVKLGHHVVYASRSAETSAAAAQATGGIGAQNPAEAAQAADLVFLAVPYLAGARAAAEAIAPYVAGKIVVDVTNPMKADGSGLATEGRPSGAETFASWLPGARVVKALNTLFSNVQADPTQHGVTIDALFATDDDEARFEVASLLRSLGYRPVYVGPLARARELEAMANLNIQLQKQAHGNWRTTFGLVSAPDEATRSER